MNRWVAVWIVAWGLPAGVGCFTDEGGAGTRDVPRAEDVTDVPVQWDTPPQQDLPDAFDVPPAEDLQDVPVQWDTPPMQDLPDTFDVPPAEDLPDVLDVPPDAGPLPERLILDPASLTFFDLPINSIRGAVSGYDAAARTCVTIVWDYSNTAHDLVPWCDEFGAGFPYVLVVRDTDGPCGQWDYSANVTATAAEGCVQFQGLGIGALDLVDVAVTVDNPAGGQTIIEARNRATFAPKPVSLGLRYVSDVPGDVYIQTGDDYGLPAWVQVLGPDGNARLLFDRYDVPSCEAPGAGVCGIAFHTVRNVTGGTYRGQAWVTWDGKFRVMDEVGQCRKAEVAAAGAYTLRACFGWATVDSPGGAGPDVKDPQCLDVPFTLPGDTQVVVVADFGG